MLFPKKVKHRKWQSDRWNVKRKRVETRGTTLAHGSYGLKAETADRITSNQIEAARRGLAAAYEAAETIEFEGRQLRHDIAARAAGEEAR